MTEIKEKIFSKTLELVSQYGIRMMSMDTLAREMVVSKKTIYQIYSNKEELIIDCVAYITSGLSDKVKSIIDGKENSILKIVAIYASSLEVILQFNSAFFYDLKKYHPKANKILMDFRHKLVFTNVLNLLTQAKEQGLLLNSISIPLICEIHFFRILELISNLSVKTTLGHREILNTLIVVNLRGILKLQHISLLDNDGL